MKKITLLLACLFAFYAQGQDYLALETFDAGLGAWTTTDGGAATGDTWISGLQGGTESLNGTNVAFVDSDANGNGTALLETLTSPVFDSSAGTVVLLEFDQFYRDLTAGAGDNGSVEVWDGAAWQQVLVLNASAGAFNAPDQQSIDITAFKNPNMQVRFVYDDTNTWAWYWLIDNVRVREAPVCVSAVVNGTSVVNDCGIGEFSIDVDVASVGEADFINDGTTDYPIVAGSNIVGPYASGTTVTLSIVDTEDSNCDFTLPNVSFTCPTLPTVDATLTINGCLDSDSFTTAFDANVQGIYWVQLDYDGGCFELTADTEGGDFDTELGLYDSNGFLVADNDDGGTGTLSSITEVGLPAGTYYLAAGSFNMAFGVDNFNATTTNTTRVGTLVVNASTPSDNTVDFCNLQFPFEGNIETGQNFEVFSQVFESGVTEPQGAQGPGIEAWIGFNTTDAVTTADFATGWTWVVADYNTNGPANNNDEYFAEIGSARAEGTYYYVSRYSIDGGPFTYGGINPGGSDGNFWDGTNFVSGVLTVTNPPPPVNDICADAIPALIGAAGACETISFNNDQATDSGVVGSCEGFDSTELDVWYSITTNATPGFVIEVTSGTATDVEVAVYDACGGNEVACVSGLSAGQNLISGLMPSTSYVLQIWTEGFSSGAFDVCLSDLPACPDPTALTVSDITEISANLGWTENGSASLWNIEYGAPGFVLGTGNAVNGVNQNPYLLEGLSSDTDYEFYVQADCGGSTSNFVGPFAFSTLPPPPANNDCLGAIALTPGTVFETNPLTGQTQAGATDSGETPLPTCSAYDPVDPTGFGGDVWYSVVVPADGNIDIETDADPTGSGGDSGMSVYSGACGALVEVGCDDDAGNGNYSLVSISDPTLANQTLYIRVFEFGGNAELNFQISAYNATLSVGTFDSESAFTYFPNPVSGALTLKAQQNIQNVSVLNMLGQEILRITPNSLESNVDMSALNTGSYFVQVTINDVTQTVRIIKN